ncbi:hypothetical protein BKA93DRAFT_166990 [Sparassis latifolia]
MFDNIVDELQALLAFQTEEGKTESSMQVYIWLCKIAQPFLVRSRFLKQLCDDTTFWHWERRMRAYRLKRCLDQVSQYVGGITLLMQQANRMFPDGKTPCRWMKDSFVGSGEGQFSISNDYLEVLPPCCGMDFSWRVLYLMLPCAPSQNGSLTCTAIGNICASSTLVSMLNYGLSSTSEPVHSHRHLQLHLITPSDACRSRLLGAADGAAYAAPCGWMHTTKNLERLS